MKTLLNLIATACLLLLFSCSQEETEDFINFQNPDERMGFWINSMQSDTLHFLSENAVIRYYSGKHEYTYRIHNNVLYFQLPASLTESRHEILSNSGNEVQLANMYRGHEHNSQEGSYKKLRE